MVYSSRQNVVLVQPPIPLLGPEPVRGNVPLAAGYLKLWAEKQGLDSRYDIQALPGPDTNLFGSRHRPETPTCLDK